KPDFNGPRSRYTLLGMSSRGYAKRTLFEAFPPKFSWQKGQCLRESQKSSSKLSPGKSFYLPSTPTHPPGPLKKSALVGVINHCWRLRANSITTRYGAAKVIELNPQIKVFGKA